VFLTIGCTRCHGDEGEGASLGPPLEALSTKFNAAQLDQFLDNPLAYLERDTRLQKWRERYFTPMPKLQMSQQQRQVLAAYLFQKHP
jgi:cytochrome c553